MFFLTLLIVKSNAQEIYSKYPCDSSITFDILVEPAKYSGIELSVKQELQKLILQEKDYKKINGKYFISFTVSCEGMTSNIKSDYKTNTISNNSILSYLMNLVAQNNWTPAIHREKRVPYNKRISLEIKKGKIKEFNF